MNQRKKSYLTFFTIIVILIITACSNNGSNENTSPDNERDESLKQVEIINEYINIREQPNTNSKALGKVNANEIYTVLEATDTWLKIETNDGTTGWIISAYDDTPYVQYLEINGEIPEEQTQLDNLGTEEFIEQEVEKYQKIEWISDIPLSDIACIKDNGMMGIQEKQFITKSGDLYEFSVDKLYSNNQVCKKIETDIKFKKFYMYPNDRELSAVISTSGDYFKYENNKLDGLNLTDPTNCFIAPSYLQLIETLSENYGIHEMGIINYDIFYHVKDNAIYEYKIEPFYNAKEGEVEYTLLHDKIFDSFPEDETFISLEGKIFKTDKAFYNIDITNQAEVDKYEDVEPEYGLVRINDISDEYSRIEYFNGDYIIYKDDPNHLYYNIFTIY